MKFFVLMKIPDLQTNQIKHARSLGVCVDMLGGQDSTLLPEFRKLDSEHRNRIVTEIMSHFIVPDKWKKQVEHYAIRKARDAWRNWKHVLYKDYMLKGKEPFSVYTMITNLDWLQFKRERETKVFPLKCVKQSALQKKNTHPHRMGVCGYYGKKPIWDKEDEEAVTASGRPAFCEIKGTRARYFIWARATRNKQGVYSLKNRGPRTIKQDARPVQPRKDVPKRRPWRGSTFSFEDQ